MTGVVVVSWPPMGRKGGLARWEALFQMRFGGRASPLALVRIAATYLWGPGVARRRLSCPSPMSTPGRGALAHDDHLSVVGAAVPLGVRRGRRAPRLISVHGDCAPVT